MDRPLIHRLTQLRRTIRLRLAAYGLCVVAAGGVVAFLTIITVDWMLGLPPVLRIITAGLFLSGFVFATLHWIVRPLQARFDLGELASRLESRFTVLQDRLVSAVNFIENGGTGSPGMMERVVHNTERALDDIRLESALTVRPLLLRATVMVASFAALLFLAAGSPDWIRTGTYRYVYPWGQIEWPRTVSIRPLTGDRIVAIGASVTVGMKIERGLSDGNWELEGRVTKQPCGAGRRSVYKDLDPAVKWKSRL